MEKIYTYLALGDSYTIGEAAPLQKSFPYQTVQMLRKKGFNFFAPEIVAKTGWTTDELQTAIEEYSFLYAYDFVTLLVGVNNQYRGYPTDAYEKEFTSLLSRATFLANKKPEHVFVLSIPDYGVTTFARKLDLGKIASEIDRYNEINKKASESFGVHYIDVTPSSREAKNDVSLLAADGLHLSEKEYTKWAAILSGQIYNLLKLEVNN
jgi:lysophospholipase L1-like esterase